MAVFDRRIVRALNVPPPPEAPAGDDPHVFKAAVGFYRQRLVLWGLSQLSALIGILFGLFFGSLLPDRLEELLGGYIRLLEFGALGIFVLQIPLSHAFVRLDYLWRWYVVTDRSLRIREGLFRVREQTVSFANVQNVSVRQGPLQRLFGIADVEIRTAGGGQASGDGRDGKDDFHKAVFHGVDNAEEIRDRILGDLRRLRDSGLGDEPEATGEEDAELEAARGLAAAARELRGALARGQ